MVWAWAQSKASDWKAAESGLNSLVQGFAAKFEEHRELSRDKGQPVQRTSLPCPSDDDAISTLVQAGNRLSHC